MTDTASSEPKEKAPADIESVPLQFDTSAPATEPPGYMQPSGALQDTRPGMVSGLSAIVGKIKENSSVLLETRKPLSEFLDRTAFSKPASITEVGTRLQKNLGYYRTNYFIFGLAIIALTFLLHPSAIIWIVFLLIMWVYLFLVQSGPLVIGGREYSEREKIIGASVITFVVVFFLTSVATTALYGISVSMALVALHASFREPDDLFLDDVSGSTNLFSSNMFQGIPGLVQAPAGSNMV
jgi:PRA1 family protein 1